MASKVNTKFVVALSVGLVAVSGGVIYFGVTALRKSAGDLAKAGDRLMAAGKAEDAGKLYAKAVNKEQTNVALLTKWIEAMEKTTPDAEVKFTDQFRNYLGAKRQLAVVQEESIPAQRAFLEMRMEMLRQSPFTQEAYLEALNDAQTIISRHEAKPAGEWSVLRRYRGQLTATLNFNIATPKQDQLDAAKGDLEAALAADPTDAESATILVDMAVRDASRAFQNLNKEEYAAHKARAEKLAADFLAKNPSDPTMLLVRIELDRVWTQADALENRERMDPLKLSQEFGARNRALLDQAFDRAKAGKQPVSEGLIGRFSRIEPLIENASSLPRTEALIREGLKAQPDNASLLLLLASLLGTQNKFEQALPELDKLVALPDKPVGLAGSMLYSQRTQGRFLQALWSAKSAAPVPSGPERDAAIERAKGYRGKLATLEDANSWKLKLVDAQLALIENSDASIAAANRLLDEVNTATDNRNLDSLLLSAQVALRRDQLGKAKDLLERILRLQPGNINAYLVLGDVESRLGNMERAIEHFRTVLRFDPNNAIAPQAISRIEPLAGGSTSDPVIRALMEGDKLVNERGSDPKVPDELIARFTTLADQTNQDPRAVIALANAYLRKNDRAGALAAINKGLAKNPDVAQLKQQKMFLEAKDPVDAAMQAIDQQLGAKDLDKALAKFQVYQQFGRPDDARRMMEEAVKLAPNDRRVVELQFVDMLDSRKFDEAQVLVDRAVKENLDNFEGETFRARLLGAQDRNAEAVTVLKRVTERGGVDPAVWRLYGRVLLRAGRPGEASDAFRSGLRLAPDDDQLGLDLIRTLASTGRMTEALTEARELKKFADSNSEFVDVMLDLEAQVGDRTLAVQSRERIQRAAPDNRTNLLKLAALYVDVGELPKARPLITTVREKSDGLDALLLDATWYWTNREPAKAREAFDGFLAKGDAAGVAPLDVHLARGRFLAERGDIAGANASFELARSKQDPKLMQGDKAISDLHQRSGDLERSIEATRRIVAAGNDTTEHFYALRVVESLAQLGRYGEAEAALADVTKLGEPSAVALLLGAMIKGGQRDDAGQRAALDLAVSRFPDVPAVFIRRAEFLLRSEATRRDGVADLNKAITLDPNNALAHRMRAGAFQQTGDFPRALADIRTVLRLAPGDNQLLFSLLSDLLSNNRREEAQDIASEVVTRRADDLQLKVDIGNFFRQADDYPTARRYVAQAFAAETSDLVAQTYLDTLLGGSSPDLGEAQRVLDVLGAERVRKSPGFTMAQAKIRIAQGRVADALRMAQEALAMLDVQNERLLSAWFNDMNRVMADKDQLRQFLDATGKRGVATEWMMFFRAASMLETPETRDQGIALFDQVVASAKNPVLRRFTFRYYGNALYTLKQYDKVLALWNTAIQESPDNPEVLNNAAYILVKHLNRPADGLPLAEKAASLAPRSSEVLDTLGLAYLKLGESSKALEVLERAFGLASSENTYVTAGLHYAQALAGAGQAAKAKEVVQRIGPGFDALKGNFDEESIEAMQNLRTTLP